MQTDAARIERILESAASVVRTLRRRHAGAAEQAPLWVLAALAEGELRPTSLAQHMHLDASTVSRHLDALAAQGLVERRPDPADGRARLARLTDQGRRALHEGKAHRRRDIADELAQWDERDVATLETLIVRLATGLNHRFQEGRP